jgi:hypothetical protein
MRRHKMRLLLLIGIMCSNTVFAKVISKKAVADNFPNAVKNCNCILDQYELDANTIDVSLSENIVAIIAEVGVSLFDNGDVYEVHADFYKDGSLFHFNGSVIVKYEGYLVDKYYHYNMSLGNTLIGNLYRMEVNNKKEEVKGKTFFSYDWRSKKKLWN